MQGPPTTKKRMLLLLVPVILLVAVLAVLISLDQARSYKKITIGETLLHAPKAYLVESKADMVGMLRDYIGTFETNMFQFNAYADEILPEQLVFDENIANSSVIWTIEPLRNTDQQRGMLPNDRAFFSAAAPYTDRTVKRVDTNGLYKLEQATGAGRNLAFSNNNPGSNSAQSEDTWLARCIELASIRPEGPISRCTNQFAEGDLLVRVHFDGRLVKNTDVIKATIRNLIREWQKEPRND